MKLNGEVVNQLDSFIKLDDSIENHLAQRDKAYADQMDAKAQQLKIQLELDKVRAASRHQKRKTLSSMTHEGGYKT